MDIKDTLNDLFVELFRDISHLEERQLKIGEFSNLTINDIHVIHAIGKDHSISMTNLAKALDITVGTLTISVNGLLKKGYVNRTRFEEDRRVVLISLTASGMRAYDEHANFHRNMINQITMQLSDEEEKNLEKTLRNLKTFFDDLRGK